MSIIEVSTIPNRCICDCLFVIEGKIDLRFDISFFSVKNFTFIDNEKMELEFVR